MPDIIRLLPDAIANQIAAGEVVQRPASAVKELMENAVDAGATTIQLIIRDAGKQLIQVIDDGSGMSETDARMSLERHATSKIRSAEDLFTLRTMGFRGEALASIAAVSQVEIKTRLAHEDLGTMLVIEASEVKKQEPVASLPGTSISVKNLFYNIPARRNFLKSNPAETRHIIDEFIHLALAHSGLSFSLVNGDELVFDLQPSRLSQRIVALFGKSYQEQLATCEEETLSVKVTGYVGRPESAKRTRGEQFLFVNNRFIRSNYIHHAVMNAFEGLLPDNSFPFYALFVAIDPKHIDVNVHPTKTEIKFDDDRAVYAVVRAAVRQALGSHNLTPALDFNADVNLLNRISAGGPMNQQEYRKEQLGGLSKSNLQNWEKIFEHGEPSSHLSSGQQQGNDIRFESALNQPEEGREMTGEKILFQFQNRFIIREVKQGLMVIDQQAAHERVLFDRFIKRLRGSGGGSQQSLFPQPIDFNPADFALLTEMEEELKAIGFRFEPFGKNAWLVQGMPAEVNGNEKEALEGLIEQFKINRARLDLPRDENLALALARRSAVKAGQNLEKEKMEALVAGLFSSSNPGLSPDGSTTFFVFDTSKMESYFSSHNG